MDKYFVLYELIGNQFEIIGVAPLYRESMVIDWKQEKDNRYYQLVGYWT
jgi:hypothetical protein